jgi:MFS family permease
VSDAPIAGPKLGGRIAWIALILISLTQAMSMVDRQILSILLPQIKADLRLGDAEMGLLYGSVFALFYALFSLPLGRLADGWVRTRLISLSIAGWSVFTGLAGFAHNFGTLAVSRLGVGIGEASVQPAGMSMLSDLFPKNARGFVTSMIAAAVALGLGGALWLGGAVSEAWNAAWPQGISAPLGLKGWQAAFLAAALPGFILAYLLSRLPEPVRGLADNIAHRREPHPFRRSAETLASLLPVLVWLGFARRKASASTWIVNIAGLAIIAAAAILLVRWTDGLRPPVAPALVVGSLAVGGNSLQWAITGFGTYTILCWAQGLKLRDRPAYEIVVKTPALQLNFAIAALQSVINYGVMGWSAPFILSTYHQSPAGVGFTFGLLVAGLGIVGPLIGGPLSDAIHRRLPGGRLYVTLAALLVSPFLAFVTYRSPTLSGFYLRFVFYSLVLTMWLPPVYATFLDLVLPRMRGMVISFYILTMTIVGVGLGPYAVGLMSDISHGDLGTSILRLYWLGPVLIVLILLLLRRLPRDEASMLDRARAAGEEV